MTTEVDFQAALDADSADWQTRLVFADWLEERGDPRAAGYRALGWLRVCPFYTEPHDQWCFSTELNHNSDYRGSCLAQDWFQTIILKAERDRAGHPNRTDRWIYFDVRTELEDAASVAFANLPPERRAEILAASPEPRTA